MLQLLHGRLLEVLAESMQGHLMAVEEVRLPGEGEE